VNLLLCPYDYILSETIRKAMSINVKDSIIIIDEAHNVENKAEECSSKELKIEDLENYKEIITD